MKLDRANREIRTQLREIKARPFSEEYLAQFERDLSLQELEARNTKALNMITDLANSDESGTDIIGILLRKGIKLPMHLKRTCSRVSWNSSSSGKSSQGQDTASYLNVKGKKFSCDGASARSSVSDMSSLKDDTSSTTSHSGLSIISLELPLPKKK